MIAHISAIRPVPDSAAPAQSIRRAAASSDSGTTRRPSRDRQHAQRHVDDEDRAPPEVVEQVAADDRAERDAEPGGRGPDADGRPPLALVLEHADQQRQRRGHDQRGARAHHRARRDQRPDAARVRRRRRGGAEHEQPGEQHAPASVAVAERPGEQQQPGERERVRVDHPLELAEVRVELAHQRRQRDVDDRVVDDDGEQARAQHAERDPARPVHDVTAARPGAAGTRADRRSRTSSTTPNAISQTLHRT